MKKKTLFLTIGLLFGISSFAQNVGINATGIAPDVNAMLDIASSDKGVLIPRLTVTQRNNISAPPNSLLVYNTDCGIYNYFDCDTWREMGDKFDFPYLVNSGANNIVIDGKTNPSQNETGVVYMVPPANGTVTYTWTAPGGASIVTGQGTNMVTVDFTTPGAGYVCVTLTNSCGTEAKSCLKVDVCTLPTAPVANAPSYILGGFTAQWSAVGDADGYYLDVATDNGFSNMLPGYNNLNVGNNLNETISGLSCGQNYYYRVRSFNACGIGTNSNIVSAILPMSPTAANAGLDQNLNCDDDFTTLAGNIPSIGSGTWSLVSGGSGTITDPNSHNTTVTGLTVGAAITFRWTTSVGCGTDSYDDVIINTSNCCTPLGPFVFTSCGVTGKNGPTQGDCNTAYTSTNLSGDVTVTSGIQEWTVPVTGTYRIKTIGGQGGNGGGFPTEMQGEFSLTQGHVLKILVGQMGTANSYGGGGGGTFVQNFTTNTLLIASGGGGGRGDGTSGNGEQHAVTTGCGVTTSGNGTGGCSGNGGLTAGISSWRGAGGGGYSGDGQNNWTGDGGISFLNGGLGGDAGYGAGGFGGGGGNGLYGGGGAGGYSGGGGGQSDAWYGGGGGSYNSGANVSNSVSSHTGDGEVTINLICP